MTEVSSKLPLNFADLDRYVECWSLPSEKDRAIKRITSSMSDLRSFHEAVFPRLDAIIEFLNTFPNDPNELPAAEPPKKPVVTGITGAPNNFILATFKA